MLTFCVHDIIISVYTRKVGDNLTPRTGRPKIENSKDIQLKIRADKQTISDLNFCCEFLDMTKSDVIRLGIQKVKSEVETKK